MHLLTKISCAIALCLPTVTAVQVFAGASKLGRPSDTCTDIQEFSCIQDVCDPFAGSDHNGRCRNGDNPQGTCPASTTCSQPTAGHCLENTISEPGLHGMPSNKHFYCVNIIDFDKPIVVWEKNDCSGKSCYIPGNGYWQAWASSEQANCVEIDPVTPINTTACLSPGQDGFFPPQGGFPSYLNLPVGGDFSLPAAYENSHTCDNLPDSAVPPQDSTVNDTAPHGDLSQAYESGLDISLDQSGADPSQFDRRSTLAERALQERALQLLTSTKTIRSAFRYSAAYIAGQQAWYFINSQSGGLVVDTRQVSDRVPDSFSVDHIVELVMIVAFVSRSLDDVRRMTPGLSANQWKLIQDLITAGGNRTPGKLGSAVCGSFFQFAQYVGSGGNVIGLQQRLNQLKGTLIQNVIEGRGSPDFTSAWSRFEAQALLDFMLQFSIKAQGAAFGIGSFLDNIAGTTGQGAISKGFETFVMSSWFNAVQILQDAVGQPKGFFKIEP